MNKNFVNKNFVNKLAFPIQTQPAPKYHTKGCSRSSAESPGARTLVFVAFEPFLGADFRASLARTPFCAILWRSPTNPVGADFWEEDATKHFSVKKRFFSGEKGGGIQ